MSVIERGARVTSMARLGLLAVFCFAGCEGGILAGDETEQDEHPVTTDDGADDSSDPDDQDDADDDGTQPQDAGAPSKMDAGHPAAPDAAVAMDAGQVDPPPRVDGPNEDRALFSGTHVYFTGSENRREVNADIELPPDMYQYQNIRLTLALRCPDGGCDAWDRHGHLSIVRDGREIEILRFVTPYRVEMSTELDVTDLRPLLTGHVTARVFIDTWVGPGNSAGAGWLVDAVLHYSGGTPPREVLSVVPLWSPGGVVVGDPSRSPARSVDVDIPTGANGARLWTIITGHGQGNAANCAEFCAKQHTVKVGDSTFQRVIWRDDCATTAAPNQQGTWQYARAGWCPGAGVRTWIEDATVQGSRVTVSWQPEGYENSCRPGVAQCGGCTLGTGCDYDGGNHTEPYYQLSALLVVYR
jgi:hypothetical protein